MRITSTTPLPATAQKQTHPLTWKPARTLYRGSRGIKGTPIGVLTLPSPLAHCVHVVIRVRVWGVLSIVVPPPFRHTKEHLAALRVRTPDSAHHASSALSYLVILISKMWPRALSTSKLHHSWTNGCANSLRGRQVFRLTVLYSARPPSTPILPYLTLRPVRHLDQLIVAEETADVSQGFVFVLGNVLAIARKHGVERTTLRVCLPTLQVRCPMSSWTMDGRFRLATSLGSSGNLGFPRTGPLTER